MNDFQKYLDEALKETKMVANDSAVIDFDYDIYEEISSKLLNVRLRKGISQKELSILSGVTQANISKIESGQIHPSLETLKRLADALGIRIFVDFVDMEDLQI